eukprot:10974448-Lingulodinium_polyedra.AAC.1
MARSPHSWGRGVEAVGGILEPGLGDRGVHAPDRVNGEGLYAWAAHTGQATWPVNLRVPFQVPA